MEKVIWLITMIPTSMVFTGIGIFAWKRKKPMWFWAGTTVEESEIADISAYNRANGIMWICYSAVFWISTVLGIFQMLLLQVLPLQCEMLWQVWTLPEQHRDVFLCRHQ